MLPFMNWVSIWALLQCQAYHISLFVADLALAGATGSLVTLTCIEHLPDVVDNSRSYLRNHV